VIGRVIEARPPDACTRALSPPRSLLISPQLSGYRAIAATAIRYACRNVALVGDVTPLGHSITESAGGGDE